MATVTLGTLLTFAVTCLVIELTPGPNMAYLAILSATKGRRAGFAATLGVALGLSIVGLAAALGLTALIARAFFTRSYAGPASCICCGLPTRAGTAVVLAHDICILMLGQTRHSASLRRVVGAL